MFILIYTDYIVSGISLNTGLQCSLLKYYRPVLYTVLVASSSTFNTLAFGRIVTWFPFSMNWLETHLWFFAVLVIMFRGEALFRLCDEIHFVLINFNH